MFSNKVVCVFGFGIENTLICKFDNILKVGYWICLYNYGIRVFLYPVRYFFFLAFITNLLMNLEVILFIEHKFSVLSYFLFLS